MNKLKPHKTVEQIARKHRLDVSFVKRQLEMGIPIEHEHTKDKDLATDIALQHLDEIPDYYTRLKKMEADAKKDHKKYKDIKENYNAVEELENQLKSLKNTSYDSIDKLMRRIMKEHDMTAKQLHNDFVKKHNKTPDGWIKNFKNIKEEKKMKGKDPCWKGYEMVGKKKKNGKEVPNCVPVKEEMGMRYCPKCKKDETRNECKYGVKYWDMYSLPSALGKDYDPNTPHPGNFPESYDHEHSMARSEISTIIAAAKRLKKKMKGEGNIEAWVQSKITKAADYLDSAADYVDSGEMKAEEYSNWRADFGLNEASAAWQRKEGKNPTGGLNAKGVASYRKENPGSKLQTAVTTKPSKLKPGSKAANRRKSFCSRMGGMPGPMKDEKGRPTRKALSLRKWNCN